MWGRLLTMQVRDSGHRRRRRRWFLGKGQPTFLSMVMNGRAEWSRVSDEGRPIVKIGIKHGVAVLDKKRRDARYCRFRLFALVWHLHRGWLPRHRLRLGRPPHHSLPLECLVLVAYFFSNFCPLLVAVLQFVESWARGHYIWLPDKVRLTT